ncbi:UNVERIFIED_ORG: hypothetical protein J2X79_004210 [Arthrobacter globiformis]|nr:hypothetical protein [Arthrobacter globiformis]
MVRNFDHRAVLQRLVAKEREPAGINPGTVAANRGTPAGARAGNGAANG